METFYVLKVNKFSTHTEKTAEVFAIKVSVVVLRLPRPGAGVSRLSVTGTGGSGQASGHTTPVIATLLLCSHSHNKGSEYINN